MKADIFQRLESTSYELPATTETRNKAPLSIFGFVAKGRNFIRASYYYPTFYFFSSAWLSPFIIVAAVRLTNSSSLKLLSCNHFISKRQIPKIIWCIFWREPGSMTRRAHEPLFAK
jgi:hypothetical protein